MVRVLQSRSSQTKDICGVMVRVLQSRSGQTKDICGVMFRVLQSRSGQTKDNIIGIFCFFAMHTAIRNKSLDWYTLNGSDMNNISTCGNLILRASTVKPTRRVNWSSTKRKSSPYHRNVVCLLHYIADKLLSWHKTTITPFFFVTEICFT